MAKAKNTSSTTRLTHANGVTVSVASEKAERLVAGGLFAEVKSAPKADPAK